MKLLLTDPKHPLRVALEHALEREFFTLLPPSSEVDWCDGASVKAYLRTKAPGVVINTLGWQETPSSDDLPLLEGAADALSRACAALDIPLIQLSSYRVFGSDHKKTHTETDTPKPCDDVGRALRAAELAVMNDGQRAMVLRLSWVLHSAGDNRLTQLLKALVAEQPWRLNHHVRGAPTALADVARVIIALVKQISCDAECWGVYHYCSDDTCTEVELAEQLMEVLHQQKYTGPEPIWQLNDNTPRRKPVSAVLSSQRIGNDFGVQTRTWRTSLQAMVKQWLDSQ